VCGVGCVVFVFFLLCFWFVDWWVVLCGCFLCVVLLSFLVGLVLFFSGSVSGVCWVCVGGRGGVWGGQTSLCFVCSMYHQNVSAHCANNQLLHNLA